MIVFARSHIFGGYACVLLNECKTRQYGFDIVLGWEGGVALVARGYFAHWRVLEDRCLFAADGERGLLNLPTKRARDTEEDTDFRSEEPSALP